MNKQKKCEKLKALTIGWKVLNLPFNVLMIVINKIGTVWFHRLFLVKFHECSLRKFKFLKQLLLD